MSTLTRASTCSARLTSVYQRHSSLNSTRESSINISLIQSLMRRNTLREASRGASCSLRKGSLMTRTPGRPSLPPFQLRNNGYNLTHTFHRAIYAPMDTKVITPSVINGSMINIWVDGTNQQIYTTIEAKIIAAYQNLTSGLAKQGEYHTTTLLPTPVLYYSLRYSTTHSGTLLLTSTGVSTSILTTCSYLSFFQL